MTWGMVFQLVVLIGWTALCVAFVKAVDTGKKPQ